MTTKKMELLVSQLIPDTKQPRQDFEPRTLALLRDSIEKRGVLVPLAVEKHNGKYLIIDGERRYRCAVALKIRKLPVTVYEPMDDLDRMLLRFNIQEQTVGW